MDVSEIVQAVISPLEKLMDTTSAAIGKIYEPRHIKKMADAKAYELQTMSEALRNNSDIPIIYNSTDITIDTSNFEEIVKRTGLRLGYQEIAKQQNIEAVIDNARTELKGCESVSTEAVDNDWTLRFFNSVEDISNEDMQRIWAKILAGEIKQPHSYSLRTLEKLRNMSTNEAKLFQNFAAFVLIRNESYFIPAQEIILEQYNINYANILKLEECGLISAKDISLELHIADEENMAFYNKHIVGKIKNKEMIKKELNLSVFRLTGSGKELYKAIEVLPNNEFAIQYLMAIRNNNSDLIFTAHTIDKIYECGTVCCSKEDLLPKIEDDESE